MSLRSEFAHAIASGQTAICIKTDEQPDAIRAMLEMCRKYAWKAQVWDRVRGLRKEGAPGSRDKSAQTLDTPNVAAMLQEVLKAPGEENNGRPVPLVTFVRNFNLALAVSRPDEIISVVQHLVEDGKASLKFLVAINTPDDKLPSHLSPLFYTINHELPDEKELGEILDGIDRDDGGGEKLSDDERRTVVKAALGLNRLQAEGAFSMSLQQHGVVRPDVVWRYKVNVINEEGLLTIYEGGERFEDVGGLDGAKEFMVDLLNYDEFDRDDPNVRARGVVFLGGPGTGKSLVVKCLGNETGRPVVMIDVGRLMGGHVGDTEASTRKMFRILKRLAPCLAIIDEFGKQMPSTTDKSHDSGVSARLAGEFLTQMQDTKEDVFYAFTENSIEHMDRGFTRAERIDAIFYVGLPAPEQRAQIWKIYFQKFFPEQLKNKAYPRHLELDVGKLLQQYRNLKRSDPGWAHKFAPALMCVPDGPKREKFLSEIEEEDTQLRAALDDALVNDVDWTPAEICSCVRLMRRLKRTLGETQNLIGHVAKGDAGRIAKIEKWCSANGALDAETGELFSLTLEKQSGEIPSGKRARRRVRRIQESEE